MMHTSDILSVKSMVMDKEEHHVGRSIDSLVVVVIVELESGE